LEYFNPGGSVKDRPALFMVEAGERRGLLKPGKTVIEATSGNTGIGLALVCSVKGYKLLLVMSESVSEERQKILRARGAELLLTPGHLGTDGAIEEAYRLVRENPDIYFMPDQFNSESNWQAHYYGTAEEIWMQTRGEVSRVVATMGTSGTLMGISRKLKEYNPHIRIIGVEPYLGHKIQGLKNMRESYRPGIFEKQRLDKKENIDDEEAFEATRRLAREEGLFVGMSSGAAMAAAQKEALSMSEGILVIIFPDGGERYLSTSLFAVKEKVELKLFNTMSRSKEIFKPILPGKASVYSCGPTAHARLHLGECRRFVCSDLLCRYLEYRGYSIHHVMNITDLDDKTISGSEKAGCSLSEFTQKQIECLEEDLHTLGIRPASRYPRTGEHLQDMVFLAERLQKNGYAYEKLRSLYFNISRIPDYGRLSGIDIQKIKLGATVDLDEYEKENPRDFTLLKRSKLSELKRGIFVKTAWGNVRPSWHLQCAAMSMKYLGDRYDIHTSSRELVFPHHENHIAISTALNGHPLAKYWIHSESVMAEGKKANEKGSPITLEDLKRKGYSGREIRHWMISTHYRKPLVFSEDRLNISNRSLKRIDACIRMLSDIRSGKPYPELDQMLYDIKHGFINAMDDDLNISAALASIFKIVKRINILSEQNQIDKEGSQKIIQAFHPIDSVLGIFEFQPLIADREITRLIEERENARKIKNFQLSDRIRDQLTSLGIEIRDGRREAGN
ncbi:MAG: cysteine--tRNA ligase, partial [Deltaproteobacteria bacterium RBG_13_49_15]